MITLSDKITQKVVKTDLGKSQSFQSARQVMTDSISYASAKAQMKAQLDAQQTQRGNNNSSK